MIRKATVNDLDAVERLYEEVHTAEEENRQQIGWARGIYPVRATAEMALEREDLFVMEHAGKLYGTAIINNVQVDVYRQGNWNYHISDDQVCVLHTLVISPGSTGKGYGREFLRFYENYAFEHGCTELRLDTNVKNTAARAMYQKHGYTEVGIVPTDFNGILGIQLVLLEKYLGKTEHKHKRKSKRFFIAMAAVFLFLLIGLTCTAYLADFYHADQGAIEAVTASSTLHYQTLEDGTMVWEPEGATKGLIFYPGGKVEAAAYIPLLRACAEQDMVCILVEMPFRLAVLDFHAADGIPERYPEVEHWYIGGHSLGGSMAAAYLAEDHADSYDGLFLLGSYSTADLSHTDLSVLSVFGSEDQVMNREKYEKNRVNLPDDFTEKVIDGGCHAYFGMYGAQEGDGIPSIRCEEQMEETAKLLSEFIQNQS